MSHTAICVHLSSDGFASVEVVLSNCAGTPLLFVVIGLAARAEYYGVRSEDGELA